MALLTMLTMLAPHDDAEEGEYAANHGEVMQLDPSAMRSADFYQMMIRLIAPRPIAWISTVSASGVRNLAPYSFFNGVTSRPPSLMFSSVRRANGELKDTVSNIQATGEFVVNVVPHALAAAMIGSSAEFPAEVDEFVSCDLQSTPSQWVAPERVALAPACFECRMLQMVEIGSDPGSATIVIGEIVGMFINDEVLGADGFPDPGKLDLIGRMGADAYATTRDRFDLKRPG